MTSEISLTPRLYLDFELEVGLKHGRQYPVTVIHSPAGEARAVMRFPFGPVALENRMDKLKIALLSSGGTRRQYMTDEEQAVKDFGKELFDAVMIDEVRTRFEISRIQARQQGKGLRLKLRLQPPELAALPWEYLYDATEEDYLCLTYETPVVRYLEVPQPYEAQQLNPPLRILAMCASPSGMVELNVEDERKFLDKATADLQHRGLLELTWLSGQSWRDLQNILRRGQWHVFHFIGHGHYDRASGEGQLAFVDEHGQLDPIGATALTRLLSSHRSLRLIFLNACEGAKSSPENAFSSLAGALVRRGLSAVLAMQYKITDRAAVEFSRVFYEALSDGIPVDASVSEARLAVSLAINNTLEWGIPVLFMRAPDGVLFKTQSASQSIVNEVEAEQERLAAEKAEQEQLAAETAEQDRLATQKAEQERLATQKAEQERLVAEASEQERLAAQKAAQERLAAETAEQERLAAKKAEQDRLAAEKAEQERLAVEKAEQERLATQKAEQMRSRRPRLFVGLTIAVVFISIMVVGILFPSLIDRLGKSSNAVPTTAIASFITTNATQLPDTSWTRPADRMTMRLVPAGGFNMGSENGEIDESPVHTVNLDAFWMDEHEVTNAMYALCLEAGACSKPGGSFFEDAQFASHPVLYVSWEDAKKYCEWADARLPTEAEWEKAGRGMLEGMTYPWGDETPTCNLGAKNGAQSNACDGDTAAVKSFAPNGFGLYDMAGNVWEWVTDWYNASYYSTSPSSNPRGPITGAFRVLRGGSWVYSGDLVRVADRNRLGPAVIVSGIGFRCSRSP